MDSPALKRLKLSSISTVAGRSIPVLETGPLKTKTTTFYKRILGSNPRSPGRPAEADQPSADKESGGTGGASGGGGDCPDCAKNYRYFFTCCQSRACCLCAGDAQSVSEAAHRHPCFIRGTVGVCHLCKTPFNPLLYRAACCGQLMCETCVEDWYARAAVDACGQCGSPKGADLKMYRRLELVRERAVHGLVKLMSRQQGHLDESFLAELLALGFAGMEALTAVSQRCPDKTLYGEPLETVPPHLLAHAVYSREDLHHLFTDFGARRRCDNPDCLSTTVEGWRPGYGHLPALVDRPDAVHGCLLCVLFEAELLLKKWLVEGSVFGDPPKRHPQEFVFNVAFAQDVGAIHLPLEPRDNFFLGFRGRVGIVKPRRLYPYAQFARRLLWLDGGHSALLRDPPARGP